MTVNEDSRVSARPTGISLPASIAGLLEWPWIAWWFGIGLVLLYIPVILETSKAWFNNENYSHGILIFPLAAFVLWLQRREIAAAVRKPVPWGLIPLSIGLLLQTGSYLLQLRYIGMWSIVLTLAGTILLLYGVQMWRVTRFAVCFLLFAGAIPTAILSAITLWIKAASTTGAVNLAQTLGISLLRYGNMIQLATTSVEVADVCSGYNKLIALLAFAALYGYMYPLSRAKRFLLLVAAIPVALFVNTLRIGTLIAVANWGGLHALHIAHNLAEIFALGLAFICYVLLGKLLGCRTVRFSL